MSINTVKFSQWADSTPTNGSVKGVKSDGVYDAIAANKDLVSSTTSFADACSRAGISYWGTLLDTYIAAGISSLSSGYNQINFGGPIVGIVLLKHNNSYYGGILITYFIRSDRPFIKFAYANGTYGVSKI